MTEIKPTGKMSSVEGNIAVKRRADKIDPLEGRCLRQLAERPRRREKSGRSGNRGQCILVYRRKALRLPREKGGRSMVWCRLDETQAVCLETDVMIRIVPRIGPNTTRWDIKLETPSSIGITLAREIGSQDEAKKCFESLLARLSAFNI